MLHLLKNDVLALRLFFLSLGSFEKSLNASFIDLNLENGGATESQDFEPIALWVVHTGCC